MNAESSRGYEAIDLDDAFNVFKLWTKLEPQKDFRIFLSKLLDPCEDDLGYMHAQLARF